MYYAHKYGVRYAHRAFKSANACRDIKYLSRASAPCRAPVAARNRVVGVNVCWQAILFCAEKVNPMYSRLPIAARSGFVLLAALLCSSLCLAQFTGSVQGSVQDPSAAGVPKAQSGCKIPTPRSLWPQPLMQKEILTSRVLHPDDTGHGRGRRFHEGGGELHLADGTTVQFAHHHEGWLGERIGHSLYRGPGG